MAYRFSDLNLGPEILQVIGKDKIEITTVTFVLKVYGYVRQSS